MSKSLEVPDHLVPALERMLATSAKKRSDYSRVGPWQNFRDTSGFFSSKGFKMFESALFNVVQKLSRIQSLSDGREIQNEPLEDSLLDMANFALFAYAMYLESVEEAPCEDCEPGSVINVDGVTLRTKCGHSFATCHTNHCFRTGGSSVRLVRDDSEYVPPKAQPLLSADDVLSGSGTPRLTVMSGICYT